MLLEFHLGCDKIWHQVASASCLHYVLLTLDADGSGRPSSYLPMRALTTSPSWWSGTRGRLFKQTIVANSWNVSLASLTILLTCVFMLLLIIHQSVECAQKWTPTQGGIACVMQKSDREVLAGVPLYAQGLVYSSGWVVLIDILKFGWYINRVTIALFR